MSFQFQYIVKIMLLSGVIATAGCSWPSVKIGDDKYLFGPKPTNETRKDGSSPESPQ
jgi:hypothetical protein